jgi:hypothetical protein
MIAWITAREVAFEKVCSTLETEYDSYSTSGVDRDFVNEGNGVTYFRTTATFADGGATQGETSYGSATNQTGYSESFSISTSFSNSASGSSFVTGTTIGEGDESTTSVTTVFLNDSESQSTSDSGSFSSSSSFGSTFFQQTTTTQTTEVIGVTTSSSTYEEYDGTLYFETGTLFTRTKTVGLSRTTNYH